MKEAKVIQNAGAVLVTKLELPNFPTSCLTNANKAISMANAISVMRAARNDVRDASRVTVIWVENERSRARNDTPAAKNTNVSKTPCAYEPPMTYQLDERPIRESN